MTDRFPHAPAAAHQAAGRLPGHARRPGVATRWPLLSPDDIRCAGEDRDLLAIRIVRCYGISLEWASREVSAWLAWSGPRPVP